MPQIQIWIWTFLSQNIRIQICHFSNLDPSDMMVAIYSWLNFDYFTWKSVQWRKSCFFHRNTQTLNIYNFLTDVVFKLPWLKWSKFQALSKGYGSSKTEGSRSAPPKNLYPTHCPPTLLTNKQKPLWVLAVLETMVKVACQVIYCEDFFRDQSHSQPCHYTN